VQGTGRPPGHRASTVPRPWWIAVAGVFLLGVATGLAAAKLKAGPPLYTGKAGPEAAAALLQAAETFTEGGSWESIFVARVRYLSGDKAGGQAVFDRVLGPKAEAGDYIRVGRVYWEAGEWDKARPLLDRVVAMKPKDADWLAEIGAYYNLKGERAHAEALFSRSLAEDAANSYNTAKMAGSYIGVVPD
jgi:tetratricopeptide (TPR) repeat protein